jgi:hypothetical protein
MSRLPFKSVFCERFKCSPDDYEEQAFRKLLYWHARFLAPVIRIIKRDFFLEDFKFIRYLGESLDVRQAKVDVLDFKDFDRKHWGLLHTGLRLRVSHRKARRLAFELFGQADRAEWAALQRLE